MHITISVNDRSWTAELNESETARHIRDALPLEGIANTWGDEIYFEIPVDLSLEADARADVAVGELGYWPTGKAFCIFFGPTPVSTGSEPRAASPVNVFGRVLENVDRFRDVADGDTVQVTLRDR